LKAIEQTRLREQYGLNKALPKCISLEVKVSDECRREKVRKGVLKLFNKFEISQKMN
jgi:hypothetical protein